MWLCKLIGHKWVHKVTRENEPEPGYVLIYSYEKKACMRCGEPNPNYEDQRGND